MIEMTALRAVLRGRQRSEASRTALKTSFRFVHAVWLSDDRSSSASGAGDGSGDTRRVDAVMSGASEWVDIVDGNADGACGGLPVMDRDFDLGLNRLRIRFILNMGRDMG
jgi:hypothetical protein